MRRLCTFTCKSGVAGTPNPATESAREHAGVDTVDAGDEAQSVGVDGGEGVRVTVTAHSALVVELSSSGKGVGAAPSGASRTINKIADILSVLFSGCGNVVELR